MEYTAKDFAALFGVAQGKLPPACEALASTRDFHYELPDPRTRDAIVLQVLRHLDSDSLTRVGEQRHGIWEDCWSGHLQRFIDSGYDSERLVPDFIRPNQAIRLKQNYAIPGNDRFELNFLEVCRAFLFDKFFTDAGSVYEFGCGSGFNLVALSQQLRGKKLYGLDWSKSSNETVSLLRKNLGIDITARHFDFFEPDRSLDLDPDSAVLTMCALEQVGSRHARFLKYLLDKKPRICVNMEPLLELYDENILADYLAARYHRKRGYLDGFLTALRDLQSERRVEILEVRRFFFGSLYHEGYSYVAWRPL